MILKILILIYLWALGSLAMSAWCLIKTRKKPCPRWVRWGGLVGALAALLLLSAAMLAGEPMSWGYAVPVATIGLGLLALIRGHRYRQPRYWLP